MYNSIPQPCPFEDLVVNHDQVLVQECRRFAGGREPDPDDLQDARLAVIQASAKHDSERGAPGAFVRVVARRCLQNKRRRTMRYRNHVGRRLDHDRYRLSDRRVNGGRCPRPDRDGVAATYPGGIDIEEIRSFVASLPDRARHIVERVFWGEATHRTVAREVSLSERRVGQILRQIYEVGRVALAEAA